MKQKIIIAILIVVAFSITGCRYSNPVLEAKVANEQPNTPLQLEKRVEMLNSKAVNLKLDNEARIIWANPDKKEKTEYVLVYIHGFSASCKEGYPVNYDFAKRYGVNMYCALLSEHGVADKEPMINLTAEKYLNSAKQALEIGRQLGNKVILMSTSTGGTLSLKLAADNPDIYALIMYSPNIDVVDKRAHWLSNKIGYSLVKLFKGKMVVYNDPPEIQKYWQTFYHLNGVRAMIMLLENTMVAQTFSKVTQPVFLGYYYKNSNEKDPTISVDALLKMYGELGTPDSLKIKVAFANAGCHPIASSIHNKNYIDVETKTYEFAERVLKLKPAL